MSQICVGQQQRIRVILFCKLVCCFIIGCCSVAKAQTLELLNVKDMRPNEIGAIAKIYFSESLETPLLIGEHGLFRTTDSPSRNLLKNVSFENDTDYQKKDGQFGSVLAVDLFEKASGFYLASDAGVFYSPARGVAHKKNQAALTEWSTTGNPPIVNSSMESERFSSLCGYAVAAPPVNISSISETALDDVILAASPDGVYRLKVWNYESSESSDRPTFCWNRVKELTGISVVEMKHLGDRKSTTAYSDVWLMSSDKGLYLVDFNPREVGAPVKYFNITSLFRKLSDNGDKTTLIPSGDVLRFEYDKPHNQIVVIFSSGIYLFNLKPDPKGGGATLHRRHGTTGFAADWGS